MSDHNDTKLSEAVVTSHARMMRYKDRPLFFLNSVPELSNPPPPHLPPIPGHCDCPRERICNDTTNRRPPATVRCVQTVDSSTCNSQGKMGISQRIWIQNKHRHRMAYFVQIYLRSEVNILKKLISASVH